MKRIAFFVRRNARSKKSKAFQEHVHIKTALSQFYFNLKLYMAHQITLKVGQAALIPCLSCCRFVILLMILFENIHARVRDLQLRQLILKTMVCATHHFTQRQHKQLQSFIITYNYNKNWQNWQLTVNEYFWQFQIQQTFEACFLCFSNHFDSSLSMLFNVVWQFEF